MSRAGRLILYPSLPSCTAHMLEAHQDDIWKVLRPRLGFKAPGIPNCYTSDPWYKVVVHDVPTRSGNLPSFEDVANELEQRNQLSSAEHKLRRTRFLDAISCADGVDRSPTFRCQPFESIWELETTCEMFNGMIAGMIDGISHESDYGSVAASQVESSSTSR
ncbi:hypothetical protein R3P38DRAFT_2759419 [Favolaschia claudopus]|uniref:Uncharacterized protein n=1 Tax=Favolaschia claudopus TaxID=2862362 RepID=A0AAW0DZM1_9AGAR